MYKQPKRYAGIAEQKSILFISAAMLAVICFSVLSIRQTVTATTAASQDKKTEAKAAPTPDPLALTDAEVKEYRDRQQQFRTWQEDIAACKARAIALDVKDESGFASVGRQFRELSRVEEFINQDFSNWLVPIQRKHGCPNGRIDPNTLKLVGCPASAPAPPAAAK